MSQGPIPQTENAGGIWALAKMRLCSLPILLVHDLGASRIGTISLPRTLLGSGFRASSDFAEIM